MNNTISQILTLLLKLNHCLYLLLTERVLACCSNCYSRIYTNCRLFVYRFIHTQENYAQFCQLRSLSFSVPHVIFDIRFRNIRNDSSRSAYNGFDPDITMESGSYERATLPSAARGFAHSVGSHVSRNVRGIGRNRPDHGATSINFWRNNIAPYCRLDYTISTLNSSGRIIREVRPQLLAALGLFNICWICAKLIDELFSVSVKVCYFEVVLKCNKVVIISRSRLFCLSNNWIKRETLM